MDTALCGASAFSFWRTPPLVRMLADPWEPGYDPHVDLERLHVMHSELYAELEIWHHGSVRGSLGRPVVSEATLDVFDALLRIAPSVTPPIDVLVAERGERRRSALIAPHVMDPELADGQLVRVSQTLCVASPALTLLTLAARLPLPRLIMAVTEFCGTFSIYEPPVAVRSLLEELSAEGSLPRVSGWSPSFDRQGRLTDLWSRPPLVSPEQLVALARRARGRRGCRRLEQAALLAVPRAASPFEAQAGMLLGLPGKLGGEALAGFAHNKEIALSPAARRLARRRTCRCDLFWDGEGDRRALDLECQSGAYHLGRASGLSDADRATALQSMDIEVLLATYGQLEDERRFDALAKTVAEKIGRELPARTEEFLAARAELRSQVLVGWSSLPGC